MGVLFWEWERFRSCNHISCLTESMDTASQGIQEYERMFDPLWLGREEKGVHSRYTLDLFHTGDAKDVGDSSWLNSAQNSLVSLPIHCHRVNMKITGFAGKEMTPVWFPKLLIAQAVANMVEMRDWSSLDLVPTQQNLECLRQLSETYLEDSRSFYLCYEQRVSFVFHSRKLLCIRNQSLAGSFTLLAVFVILYPSSSHRFETRMLWPIVTFPMLQRAQETLNLHLMELFILHFPWTHTEERNSKTSVHGLFVLFPHHTHHRILFKLCLKSAPKHDFSFYTLCFYWL